MIEDDKVKYKKDITEKMTSEERFFEVQRINSKLSIHIPNYHDWTKEGVLRAIDRLKIDDTDDGYKAEILCEIELNEIVNDYDYMRHEEETPWGNCTVKQIESLIKYYTKNDNYKFMLGKTEYEALKDRYKQLKGSYYEYDEI